MLAFPTSRGSAAPHTFSMRNLWYTNAQFLAHTLTRSFPMAQVFISYSRADEEIARKIATDLDRLNLDVWIDTDDIPPGVNWSGNEVSAFPAPSGWQL